MKRTIKFRAYDKERKEYLSAGHIFLQINAGRNPADCVQYLDLLNNPNAYANRFVIEQFVGVTDEHGNEVFEGDVLEADYKYDRLGYNGGVDPDNDCICYGVVEFDNDALQWVLNIHKAEYPISKQIEEDGCSLVPLQIFGHEYGYDNCNLKIIGNRFDTPSLISDKQ